MLTVVNYLCCLNLQLLSVPVSTIDYDNLFWNSCIWIEFVLGTAFERIYSDEILKKCPEHFYEKYVGKKVQPQLKTYTFRW